MTGALSESELWILSFYRNSEISGALFFGRLARSMKPGTIQRDMTKHFADESLHAWYWTSCIEQLNAKALKLRQSYQDQYVAAAGMPANLMEVLALTLTFERRVIGQYTRHANVPTLRAPVKDTLDRIMKDEQWHLEWVGRALKEMEVEYGADYIRDTLHRYKEADMSVYSKTIREHEARIKDLIKYRMAR